MQDHKRLARSLRQTLGRAHFIWSRREDKVAQAFSFLKAKQTGRFSHEQDAEGTQVADRKNLTCDFGAIDSLVRQFEDEEQQWKQFFHLGKIRPLIVTYEDIVSNYAAEVEHVLRYIGVWDETCGIRNPQSDKNLADEPTTE